MKKNVLLLTALLMSTALSVAGARQATNTPATVTVPAAQDAALIKTNSTLSDPRLSARDVTIQIGSYSGQLSALLAGIARASGYEIIYDTDVDAVSSSVTQVAPASGLGVAPVVQTNNGTGRKVVYNFKNTPFNQVWPLLMDVYGLSYEVVEVGTSQVLRVGTQPVQAVISLKNANAAEAVNQIKLFFGTPTYSETPIKDAQGNVTGTSRTLTDVKLDSGTLRIVADVRANTLIVRGTTREVNDVRRVAAEFDNQVKATTTTSAVTSTSQIVQQVYKVKGNQADILAVFTAQYPGLKVTPVGGTGQLILQGPKNVIDEATTLIGSVDVAAPVITATQPDVVQKIFALNNAQASDLKTVLEGTLARSLTATALVATPVTTTVPVANADGTTTNVPVAQSAAGTTGTTATGQTGTQAGSQVNAQTAAQTGAPAATIIADDRTNTLVVRGTQQQVTQIAELIPAFDVRVPQINVQVRIQEVGQTASRALGVDWKGSFGNFMVNIASTAVKAIFDPTQALAGFNLGATLNTLENQGLTKRVYDGAVTMQSGQRALGNSTSVQNSSSNAAAHVQSGGRIELNIPAGAGVAPIQRQIDYGVTLDFYNPQVAPDGTITVRVQGKVAGQPGDLANPQLIQYTNSEAQTTISFKPGETVLLTGLMGTNTVNTTSGVPFLSSIPVIGALFGKTTTDTSRTQLMVVLTGDVLK